MGQPVDSIWQTPTLFRTALSGGRESVIHPRLRKEVGNHLRYSVYSTYILSGEPAIAKSVIGNVCSTQFHRLPHAFKFANTHLHAISCAAPRFEQMRAFCKSFVPRSPVYLLVYLFAAHELLACLTVWLFGCLTV